MTDNLFADIILPIAVRERFTYRIPEELIDKVKTGGRVVVPFGGRNFYSGIVSSIHNKIPELKNIRSIASVPDLVPAINKKQLKLWLWISEYYLCSEGEVMKAAMPSETSLTEYRPRLEPMIGLSKEYSDSELNEILDTLEHGLANIP